MTVHGSSLDDSLWTDTRGPGGGCELSMERESETSVRCLVRHSSQGIRRVVMTAGEHGSSLSILGVVIEMAQDQPQ